MKKEKTHTVKRTVQLSSCLEVPGETPEESLINSRDDKYTDDWTEEVVEDSISASSDLVSGDADEEVHDEKGKLLLSKERAKKI